MRSRPSPVGAGGYHFGLRRSAVQVRAERHHWRVVRSARFRPRSRPAATASTRPLPQMPRGATFPMVQERSRPSSTVTSLIAPVVASMPMLMRPLRTRVRRRSRRTAYARYCRRRSHHSFLNHQDSCRCAAQHVGGQHTGQNITANEATRHGRKQTSGLRRASTPTRRLGIDADRRPPAQRARVRVAPGQYRRTNGA